MSGSRSVQLSDRDFDAVRDGARALAFDRYLTALLAPLPYRQDLLALAAFVGEIERIPLVISDPTLGEIRFRWWLDWLDDQRDLEREDLRTGNPVADVFADVIRRRQLPIGKLRDMVDARALELYAEPFENGPALDEFLAKTGGASFELAARIVTGDGSIETDREFLDNADAFGRAYGCTVQLMRLPQLASRGRWGLSGNGEPVDASGLIQSEEREKADGVRLMTIEKARGLLDEARQLGSGYRGAQCAAVLPAALVEPYLKALEKQDDWLRETADIAPLSRVWRLWWAKQSARI